MTAGKRAPKAKTSPKVDPVEAARRGAVAALDAVRVRSKGQQPVRVMDLVATSKRLQKLKKAQETAARTASAAHRDKLLDELARTAMALRDVHELRDIVQRFAQERLSAAGGEYAAAISLATDIRATLAHAEAKGMAAMAATARANMVRAEALVARAQVLEALAQEALAVDLREAREKATIRRAAEARAQKAMAREAALPLEVTASSGAAVVPWTQPNPMRARVGRAFDVAALFVPKRIADEEFGDAMEVIAELIAHGRSRWEVYLKVATTIFWVLFHALRAPRSRPARRS